MRGPLALLVIVWLVAGIGACGGAAGTSTRSAPRSSPSSAASSTPDYRTNYTKVDGDKDSDIGAAGDDKIDNSATFAFGHAAGARDRGAITALVKRFFAAALADDGAAACSMLYSTIAETAVEDYSPMQGPIYLRGSKTCKELMTRLFSHFHARLALQAPKLEVTHVIVKERRAIAMLGFAAMPEREIQLDREGHAWRVAALFDSELP